MNEFDERDETKRFSLGTILTKMRACSKTELADAISAQSFMNKIDRLGLGELLISRGKISGEQLEIALAAQIELRSPDKSKRALAAARLSKVSSDRVVKICRDVRESSSYLRKVTGEYSAIECALKEV